MGNGPQAADRSRGPRLSSGKAWKMAPQTMLGANGTRLDEKRRVCPIGEDCRLPVAGRLFGAASRLTWDDLHPIQMPW
jgi:hypothetical protein